MSLKIYVKYIEVFHNINHQIAQFNSLTLFLDEFFYLPAFAFLNDNISSDKI